MRKSPQAFGNVCKKFKPNHELYGDGKQVAKTYMEKKTMVRMEFPISIGLGGKYGLEAYILCRRYTGQDDQKPQCDFQIFDEDLVQFFIKLPEVKVTCSINLNLKDVLQKLNVGGKPIRGLLNNKKLTS